MVIILHQVECGFVWVDPEWPEVMKKEISRLWGMYNQSVGGQIRSQVESSQEIINLLDDRDNLERKYAGLESYVGKWITNTRKSVMSGYTVMDYPATSGMGSN